jgi:hypothetical protein
MATWTSSELSAVGAADELEISTRRRDGTLRKPVTISPEARSTTIKPVPHDA